MWVDTHAHFPTEPDLADAWVADALGSGVDAIVAVGGSPSLNRTALQAARRHPGTVCYALGLDRGQAAVVGGHQASAVDDLLLSMDEATASPSLPRCVAVGEIGLDYHYAQETAAAQRQLFAAQLTEAARRARPVIVHSRHAEADTLDVLDAVFATHTPPASGPGVLHCFTGDWPFARQLLDRGFLISFSGILTFRNASALRAVAARIPSDRLLIETDAPYLTPVPDRGKPNMPSRVTRVAQCLADLRGCSLASLSEQLRVNSAGLFGWPDPTAGRCA